MSGTDGESKAVSLAVPKDRVSFCVGVLLSCAGYISEGVQFPKVSFTQTCIIETGHLGGGGKRNRVRGFEVQPHTLDSASTQVLESISKRMA